jgi:hypothetical protein
MKRLLLAMVVLLGFVPEADAKAVRAFVGRYGYRDPGPVFLVPTVDYGGIRAETAETPGSPSVIGHGPQLGVGMLGVSAGDRDFQGQAGIGYRHMNLEGIEVEQRPSIEFIESSIGLRYFPRAPTLLLAEQFCIRLTGAASAGASISTKGDLNFPIDLAAGLHFTTGRAPHGLAVEIVHRANHFDMKYRPDNDPGDPVVPEAKYDVSPWTALRVSVYFGP